LGSSCCNRRSVVQVADDERAHAALGVVEPEHAELRHQVAVQVLLLDEVRLERGQIVHVDVAAVGRGRRLVELVAVDVRVPVDLRRLVPLHLLRLLRGRGLRRLRGLEVLRLQRRFAGRLLREISLDLVWLLEERVLVHLLAHLLQQLHPGELQQLDRLLQLGSHHQLLRELQVLLEFHPHRF
jgi:hypothetical protein